MVDVAGDVTLLDLVLTVQEFTQSEHETVATVNSLLESGRVRLRSPAARGEGPAALDPD